VDVTSDRTIYLALDELVRRHAAADQAGPSPRESLTRHEYRCFSQNGEKSAWQALKNRGCDIEGHVSS
jgi:hypothetical protein